jgi:hypothetical protein
LGCNAGAILNCRYCGFNEYKNITCPTITTTPAIISNLINATNLNRTILELIYSSVNDRKTIDLSNLNIHSIHNETFLGLSKLENLYLQNNSIRRIEFYSKDLQSLKLISLEFNNIVQINKSILVGLNKIESVCLFNNPISNLFPTEMLKICETNPICKVYINEKC